MREKRKNVLWYVLLMLTVLLLMSESQVVCAQEPISEKEIDLEALEEGESVTIYASLNPKARMMQAITITKGQCFEYADYGYGDYRTYQYHIQYGNVSAIAYCVQPSVKSPGSGTHDVLKLDDQNALAKVCYYGSDASGEYGFFARKYPHFSEGQRFILMHMATSYANGSEDAFMRSTETAQALALELYQYCVSQPEIPSTSMSFSDSTVLAYVEDDRQWTKEVTFQADTRQKIRLDLPKGVTLHNVSARSVSEEGSSVEISGGTKFRLSAPLTQVEEVSAEWSPKARGSLLTEYSAYRISTGSNSQDLAFLFGEGAANQGYVAFNVEWVKLGRLHIYKEGEMLVGADIHEDGIEFLYEQRRQKDAVFNVYAEEDIVTDDGEVLYKAGDLVKDDLVTDETGTAVLENLHLGTYRVQEVQAPHSFYNGGEEKIVVLTDENVEGEAIVSEAAFVNERQKANISLVKTDIHTGEPLERAMFAMYTDCDICDADGEVAVPKGTLVEIITTNEEGMAVFEADIPIDATYKIREIQAPEGYRIDSAQEYLVEFFYTNDREEELLFSFECVNEKIPETPKIVSEIPDTGDTHNMINWAVQAAAALLVICVIGIGVERCRKR